MKASLASIDAALAALPAQEAAAINAAQDRADAAIATLREATVDRLKFLADLETQLVQEQIARAEERRQRLVKDLEDLVGPDRAAALIANANAGLVVELARLNQTLMDLNTILRAIPSAQGGLGPLPRDQLVFAHRGEVIGHPQQIGTSTSITIAPNINVTVQGTQNPQRDGAEFGRAVASLLLEEFRRGKFGAEIRRELKR
jgi:anion-transporting  ArsA/GET3 family ATPase